MVLVQKWPFFQLFFFRQYRPGKCLYDIPKRKNAFLGFKTKKFKKSKKIDIFPKGLTHGFGIKIGIFRTFFLKQSRPWKCFFYDILVRKSASLGFKNTKFKKSKISHFSKGLNPWFWSKNRHFSNFFFRQYMPGKYLLRYYKTKKRPSRL